LAAQLEAQTVVNPPSLKSVRHPAAFFQGENPKITDD
jgi:hypothetical protein